MTDRWLLAGPTLVQAGEPARPVDLVIDGGLIAEVAPAGTVDRGGQRVVDAAHRLLIAGLVNAHTHSHANLHKGVGDRWTLEVSLLNGTWMAARDPAQQYAGARLGAIEHLRRGTTTVFDLVSCWPEPTPELLAATVAGYRSVGVRAVLAPMLADRAVLAAIGPLGAAAGSHHRADPIPTGTVLAQAERLVAAWPQCRGGADPAARSADPAAGGAPVAQLALAPTIPLHCADELMVGLAVLARGAGLRLHLHLAESPLQAAEGRRRYGCSLVAHLERIGLLGPDLTVAHAIHLSAEDRALLAASGTRAVHVPGSNLRLGSGTAAVRALLDAGVPVGLATDGCNSSDHLNLFEAMRLASGLGRPAEADRHRWLGAHDVLALAGAGGAAACGLDGGDGRPPIGRIEVGAAADLVLLDAGAWPYVPVNDLHRQLVYVEDGSSIRTVIVAGRVVLDDGRPTMVDEAEVLADAITAAGALRAATVAERAAADATVATIEAALTAERSAGPA
ncbi:MAG: amidohydrolase family protein [Acidimicrobiales bacterium]